MNKKERAFLAGDIGGTKTHLAIFTPGSGVRTPLAEATFASRDYPGLAALLRVFLARIDVQIVGAAFGVAGPVVNGQSQITNLPWVMDEAILADALQLKSVRLLNDLEAIASVVPFLDAIDLVKLNKGLAVPSGAMAVIAPGTGLGEAFMIWDGTRYRAFPSEGGHADFAPNNALETQMLLYLHRRFAHVSWERVCSGSGIPNIYSFLKDSGHADEPGWLAERLAATDDPTPILVAAALNQDPPCRICQCAIELFLATLGAEAGNLALKVMATGGIILGGGIPPRIVSALQNGIFMDAFTHKGRMTPWVSRVPVAVITNPKAALWGAAREAMGMGCRVS